MNRLGQPIGPPKAVLRYCEDCGRRFFNLGWHAEACGSSNFREVVENPDWERDREREGMA